VRDREGHGEVGELEAGLAESLKGVGRGTRLEGARTENFCAGFGDAFGDGKNLFARFDGTRASGDDDFVAADFYATAKIDDGAFRLELAARELERLRDAHDFAHAFEKLEIAVIEIAMDADGAENGVGFAGGAMNVETGGDEAIDNVLDLRVAGAFLHDDDHKS